MFNEADLYELVAEMIVSLWILAGKEKLSLMWRGKSLVLSSYQLGSVVRGFKVGIRQCGGFGAGEFKGGVHLSLGIKHGGKNCAQRGADRVLCSLH